MKGIVVHCNYASASGAQGSFGIDNACDIPEENSQCISQSPWANTTGKNSSYSYACPYTSCSYNEAPPPAIWCAPINKCTVGIDAAVGKDFKYTIKWNNVITNLAKGEVAASKLAASLATNGSYTKPPTASYDGKAMVISLFKSGNPFLNAETFDDCQAVFS